MPRLLSALFVALLWVSASAQDCSAEIQIKFSFGASGIPVGTTATVEAFTLQYPGGGGTLQSVYSGQQYIDEVANGVGNFVLTFSTADESLPARVFLYIEPVSAGGKTYGFSPAEVGRIPAYANDPEFEINIGAGYP